MTLDEHLQQFATALISERDARWAAGDAINDAGLLSAAVVGAFAAAGHCTTAFVRQLSSVARAFSHAQRFPDVSWTFYRSVLGAAKRLGRETAPLLDEAMAQGWHSKELAALGRVGPTVAALERDCGGCGAEIRIRLAGCTGLGIACPVCQAEGRDEPLGVLA